ncbi:hypothetical protein BJF78_16185 [Pseudonocardia sp. CNS-139]|nr:hypothetical protein BJF78_16185 [Pseudonocardia sp. CNS-139]
MRFTVKWLEMIGTVLPTPAAEIDSGDYSDPLSTIDLFHAGMADEHRIGIEANVDVAWLSPLHDIVERVVAAGYGPQSISALTEVLLN